MQLKWRGAVILPILLAVAGCSSVPKEDTSTPPIIESVKSVPGTFELTQKFKPKKKAEIIAVVQDPTSEVVDVRLRFLHVPLDVPMRRIAGTNTWHGELTPEQLKDLAVSGETMKYEAVIIATNKRGKTAVAHEPLDVAVKAPTVSRSFG